MFLSIRHPVDHCARTLVSSPLHMSMPTALTDDASPDSKCLLTGSFTSDSLNDFVTINDRDRGTPRCVARCSGTAVLPVPLLLCALMIVLYMPLTSFSSSQLLLPPAVDGLCCRSAVLAPQSTVIPSQGNGEHLRHFPASQQISYEPISTVEVRGQR